MDHRTQTELQNFLNQMDTGAGGVLVRWLLFAFLGFIAATLFIATNFQGLKSAETMEYAQLARNFAQTGRFRTQAIRPFALGELKEFKEAKLAANTAAAAADEEPTAVLEPAEALALVQQHPDLTHPPLYTLALAGIFKLTGMPVYGREILTQIYRWDYVPVVFNAFLFIISALLIGAMARRMFDLRVAALAMASWLLSAAVWQEALLGANMALAIFLLLCAAFSALCGTESASAIRLYLAALFSAIATAAAFLTQYPAAVFALPLFLFIGTAPKRGAWGAAIFYLLLVLLLPLPWLLRNFALSGHLFGYAPFQAIACTNLYPADALQRTIHPSLLNISSIIRFVQAKAIANLRDYAPLAFGLATGGIFSALAAGVFLHRFHRSSSHRLRWCILPAIPLFILIAAIFSADKTPAAITTAMLPFLPFILIYAWAFALILLDRVPFISPLPAYIAITALLLVGAMPYLLHILPPKSLDNLPYPPYYNNHIAWTASLIHEDEHMISDMPWASAWYGGRTAILLPRDLGTFYTLHNQFAPVSLAYFTPITRNKAWVKDLASPNALDHAWYRIFTEKVVPRDFPLPEARIFFGEDEMILVDRPRWAAPQ